MAASIHETVSSIIASFESGDIPLHKIKAIMRGKDGKLPNNFHRDYIREHRIFGPAIRNALASYKWI